MKAVKVFLVIVTAVSLGLPKTPTVRASELHAAAGQGDLAKVTSLLSKGKEVDEKDENGLTPLHYAAATAKLDIVKYLVARGANVDSRDSRGKTPLHYAAAASISIPFGDHRFTDIGFRMVTLDPQFAAVVDFLLAKRAKCNVADAEGLTPLHEAAGSGTQGMNADKRAKALLAAGADPFLKNKQGKTPYELAVEKKNRSLAEILVESASRLESSYAGPKIPKKDIPSNIDRDVRQQIEHLYSSSPIDRAYAADKLGDMKEKAIPAIPFLIGMLGQGPTLLKQTFHGPWTGGPLPTGGPGTIRASPGEEAKTALIRIGQAAVDPLIATLKSRDRGPGVQIQAAKALGYIKDLRAVEPLSDALTDQYNYWTVREHAAKALGGIRSAAAVQPLITALEDDYWPVRAEAIKTLAEIRDPAAVQPLVLRLKDPSWNVRAEAAKAFQTVPDVRAVEPLTSLLNDKIWQVRASAATALGAIKHPFAVEPLIKVLTRKGEDIFVEIEAQKALENTTGEKFGKNPSWQEWWDENKAKYQVPTVDR